MEKSLPSAAYTDATVFARERDGIFRCEWSAVCRAEDIAASGDYFVADIAGDEFLIVRGRDNQLRAFWNVCRHRGARLCRPRDEAVPPDRAALPRAVQANGWIRCPYHAWLYDETGRLRGAPHLAEGPDFALADFALYPAGCAEWGGFVFLHPSPGTASPLAAQLGAMPERIARYGLEALRTGHRIRYRVAANWKIICENYNECYHCGPIHPELSALVPVFRETGGAGLEWERGIPHRDGADTFSWSGTAPRASFPALNADERTRHKGELLYPNLFLSLAREHVAAYILQPRGPAETIIDCLFLFAAGEVIPGPVDHADVTDFWDTVNRQDWTICEAVQHGMGQWPHRQGYYAPMEDWNLDMRAYIAARIGPV